MSFLISITAYSQEKKSSLILAELLKIEDSNLEDNIKLLQALNLKKDFEGLGIAEDSVYARILHKIGVWRYSSLNDINGAIAYTIKSLQINLKGSRASSPAFASNSYLNLGIYYKAAFLFKEALNALDSALFLANKYPTDIYYVYTPKKLKAEIFFATGNFELSIYETSSAIITAKENVDLIDVAILYLERSFSKVSMGMYEDAFNDIAQAASLLHNQNCPTDVRAALYKAKAFAFEKSQNNDSALFYYKLALKDRSVFDDPEALSNEYSDFAVFLYKNRNDSKSALKYYNDARQIALSSKYFQSAINVCINLSDLYISKQDLPNALINCKMGLQTLVTEFKSADLLENPSLGQLLNSSNLFSAFSLLANKSEGLLLFFLQEKALTYINAALETCKLNDYIIDELRRRQNSFSSKLFWQKKTRNFYRIAIDVSYLANDPASILYFMEKSRAVLLNDKLNELGSLAYLPAAEAEQEQQLRINIASLEKQKQALSEKDTAYNRVSQALLHAKEDFNQFIKTLETKFPVYYQYKYSVSVPSIADIRSKLLTNEQTYLSFFETDSVVYALLISKSDVQFKKLAFPGYADTVNVFAQLCKDRQLLNSSYSRYASLANVLYKKLFEPLNVPKGKVIVSPDLNFIPLDALTIDEAGKSFLLYDYTFDYTYSAGYLIKTMNIALQKGAGFLGIAPESFSSNLSLAKLYGSAASLESIFDKYSYGQLLKYSQATRSFFLNKAGTFNLLHLYAHAKADGDSEPVLYMNDSAVAVSELHQWNNPKVGLAFLAACETGAGELNIGEGINSIARSFAAIGVPSTIATLWKADNKAMYAISERFYSYLNQGLTKDEALQKAKIDFIASGSGENALPYYWASAVLSGNAAPVKLPAQNTSKKYWLIPLLFAFATGAVYYRRKTYRRKTASANI